MTQYAFVFSPEARDDLLQLYRYIAEHSGAERAIGYIERIEAFCQGFSTFPDRGASRDDLFSGLRVSASNAGSPSPSTSGRAW